MYSLRDFEQDIVPMRSVNARFELSFELIRCEFNRSMCVRVRIREVGMWGGLISSYVSLIKSSLP